MDYTQNSFTRGNVLPKYVAEETLKRSRVDTSDGPAIRVKTIASDITDLSTLESNTRQIKNSNNDIKQVLGTTNDSSTANTVVGLLKRIHSTTDESIEQIIEDINTLQSTKADKSNTYTKTEINNALNLKADKSDTYTKTELDNSLALKADKNTTYTKTEVDNLITNSEITNYVTTDTLQSITGTKLCNELHANSFYTESILLKNHTYNSSSFKLNDQSDKNYKLCSEAYIRDLIRNSIEEKITYYNLDLYYIGSFNIHLKINDVDTWIETCGTAIIVATDLNRLYITNLRLNVQTTTSSRIDLIEIIITKKDLSQYYYRPLSPSINCGSGAGVCGRNWQLTSCSSIFTLAYTGFNYNSFVFWDQPTTKTYSFSAAYWSFFLNGFMFDLYDNVNDKYVYYQ